MDDIPDKPARAPATAAEAALRERLARLEAEGRQRDAFLATLAHELRNALAPLRSAARLLEHGPAPDATAQQARAVIGRQSAQLARMVDDLLDVSRVAAGKMVLRRAVHDARAVAEAAVEGARSAVEARQQRLELRLPPAGTLWVDGDMARLAQALANLLLNASKYTPAYGRIELALAGTQAQSLAFSVSDDGVGLDAALLPRVFEPYAQADVASQRSGGGLGLGLALVRSLVEMHGGSVAAHSDGPGRGARFTLHLPQALPPAVPGCPGCPGEPDASPRPPLRPRRVLLVDDNPDAGLALALLLELDGHRVTRCLRGIEARERAGAEAFDVVLLDIGLPDLDGLSVARAIRAGGASRRAQLIAISGLAQPEDRAASIQAGFDAHLVKPVDEAALQALFAAEDARRSVEERVAQRLGDARLHRFLDAWQEVRGAARWAPLAPLLDATAALEPQRAVALIEGRHPAFAMRFIAVGAGLDALLPQSLLGRRFGDTDVASGRLEAAYRLVALSGEPGHECVEYDFGPGDRLRFERLIVPATAEPGSALPTHLVAMACFDPPPDTGFPATPTTAPPGPAPA
ncbi:hybrid sensor histidine kinase/response regulator [Azohydromonas aeria]|uniref:hybrid sensor histidine kinase/response regulator n=1 Tax=Azohydromonas aeria TaxID=2590212 RepID=UPI0012FAD75E|nr:hybrid sensor histidine kinase/response regulator [Azohydromonas aeria]